MAYNGAWQCSHARLLTITEMQEQGRYLIFDGKPPGPLARLLTALVAMALAAIGLVFGVFFFLAFLVIACVVAAVLWFRLKPLRQHMREVASQPAGEAGESIIEGEFTVVDEARRPNGTGS